MEIVVWTSGTLYKDWVSTSLSLISAEPTKTLRLLHPTGIRRRRPCSTDLRRPLAQGHDPRELFGYTIDENRVASGSGGEAVCCVSGTTVGKH